jgi:RNA-directed DNA polymerase
LGFSSHVRPSSKITVQVGLDLSLNHKKSRLLRPSQRQIVTGIVVNKRLNVPRKFRSEIRKNVFFLKKFGLYGHARHVGISDPFYFLEKLIGQVAHWRFVDPKNKEALEYSKILQALKRGSR